MGINTPTSAPNSGDKRKETSKVKLASVEEVRAKMTEQEKATFDNLQADFMKASGICKPLLRTLSAKREKLCDDIGYIEGWTPYILGAGAGSIAVPIPWVVGVSTFNNLCLMSDAIIANRDKANIDELDQFSVELEKASDDFYTRFMKYRKTMREKYSK